MFFAENPFYGTTLIAATRRLFILSGGPVDVHGPVPAVVLRRGGGGVQGVLLPRLQRQRQQLREQGAVRATLRPPLRQGQLAAQGANSIEKFGLNFWLEKPLGIPL